jgi:hypothetical protein
MRRPYAGFRPDLEEDAVPLFAAVYPGDDEDEDDEDDERDEPEEDEEEEEEEPLWTAPGRRVK